MAPRRHHESSVDADRVVMPVAKLVGYALSGAIILVGAIGAYYTIVGRIDRIDERMAAQSETLKSLAGSLQKIAEDALTASDLKAACMQMQIANQGKGWVCPFSGVEVKTAPLRSRPVIKTSEVSK